MSGTGKRMEILFCFACIRLFELESLFGGEIIHLFLLVLLQEVLLSFCLPLLFPFESALSV